VLREAPTYREDEMPTLELSGNNAKLDWSDCFHINGDLDQFVLFINSSAVYIGPATTFTYTLPTTSHTYAAGTV